MSMDNATLRDAIETAMIKACDDFQGWPEITDAALRALADAGPDDAAVEAAADVIFFEYARLHDWSGEQCRKLARAALAAALKTMGR